jgi:hypothetical protein
MSVEKKTVQNAGSNPPSADIATERLRRDIYRPDTEKFKLFTQMLRANALFKKAKITHK